MGNIRVLVVLSMEPFALASAVQESLKFNPHLDVIIAGVDHEHHAASVGRDHSRPTVTVQLKEFPARFELRLAGSGQAVAYETLGPVLHYLAAYAGEPDVWPVNHLTAPAAADSRQHI
jgi:hypothetical protein